MRFSTTSQRNKAIALAVVLIAAAAGLALYASGIFSGGESEAVRKDSAPARAREAEKPACPLCGMVVTDPAALARRPVAVKVENDPAARPQSGLGSACIVYEEECEAGVTRFMAVYLCRDVSSIGPIRSARQADIDLVFPYKALFCHCGGGPPILAMVQASGVADLDEQAWGGAYWRTSDRRAPHNLYSSTERLRAAGDRQYPFSGETDSPFVFLSDKQQAKMELEREKQTEKDLANLRHPDPAYAPDFTVVTNVHIPYESSCAVDYRYDTTCGRFRRSVRGVPHMDRNGGEQLMADTVIVQYVTTTPSGFVDVNGADTPNLGVTGSGRAQVFVRGRLVDAKWSKPSRSEHTVYTDSSGRKIPVKPGVTWIQLVPTDMVVPFN